MLAGKTVVVCGYGDVGKGSAQSMKSYGCKVIVTEIDPICALQAAMEGFEVRKLEDVLERGNIFVTTTGNKDIITLKHMRKNEGSTAIVCNIGHFDNEIQVDALNSSMNTDKLNIFLDMRDSRLFYCEMRLVSQKIYFLHSDKKFSMINREIIYI